MMPATERADSISVLTLPDTTCVVCSTETIFLNDVCTRCGATRADGRAVLRAGAAAYEAARTAAMEMRWNTARKELSLAASLGMSESEEWKALGELIAAADPVAAISDALAYAQARTAALRGDYLEAVQLPLSGAPTAEYLQTLCRQGAQLRTEQRRRIWWNTGAVSSLCALLAVAATWSLRPVTVSAGVLQEKTPTPTPTPIASSPAPIATPTPAALPTAEAPYPYPRRIARRYFNDALQLRRDAHYQEAARVADLAIRYSNASYLLPDALLLRAELANILKEPEAPQMWARIAHDAPDSSYAPLGLLRAAQSAKKIAQDPHAAQIYVTELVERYPSSNEARRVRDSFSAPDAGATKDHTQRQ